MRRLNPGEFDDAIDGLLQTVGIATAGRSEVGCTTTTAPMSTAASRTSRPALRPRLSTRFLLIITVSSGFFGMDATEHAEHVFRQLTRNLERKVLDGVGRDGRRQYAADELHAADRLGGRDETVALGLNLLVYESLHLMFQLAVVVYGFLDGHRQVLGAGEEGTQTGQQVVLRVNHFLCRAARYGLDATHTGGDAALGDDAHHAKAARAAGVATAAELDAAAELHDAHAVAVLLAEEGRWRPDSWPPR